ncbi:serine O-acetyltransferase [Ferruginibacter sp. SUN106]|uniref:serine O-acetyltransferase n=1 Tax=Ferruginibacter sp. SUN106 TaxID=2978348 RepID=UPI003D3628F4
MEQQFYTSIVNFKKQQGCSFPDASGAKIFVNKLFEALFICKSEADNNEFEIQSQLKKLESQLQFLLFPVLHSSSYSETQTTTFFSTIPQLYKKLLLDATAIFEADPAAKNIDEVLIAYPGFFAIAAHRIAHQLHQQKIPLLPRIISEYAHSKTGIDIHPAATIGESFSIDHGTGIVIGETTTIGNNVKIFQGVTLGALTVQKEKASEKRHPTIQDNVVIYSNATILGGETVVGHDSVIGGNVWLTEAVQPFSIVFQQSEITIRDKKTFTEPYNYFI